METHNTVGTFGELSEEVRKEYRRARTARDEEQLLTPPATIRRFTMAEWRESLQLLGVEKIIGDHVKAYYKELFYGKDNDPDQPETFNPENGKLDFRRIGQMFGGGKIICLVTTPVNEAGLPATPEDMASINSVRRLELGANGLTYNFGSQPAFLSHLFPEEILAQCTIHVPDYEQYNYPNLAEVKQLRQEFFRALDNLENLLD